MLDAIDKIKKTKISNAVKHVHPKLQSCFAECLHLFRILDVSCNNTVSQQEWLKFSLPHSLNPDFEKKKKAPFQDYLHENHHVIHIFLITNLKKLRNGMVMHPYQFWLVNP